LNFATDPYATDLATTPRSLE